MTTIQKIKFLREERFQDLNDWERDFIGDLFEFTQDAEEELSRRQIEKVDDIWKAMGL